MTLAPADALARLFETGGASLENAAGEGLPVRLRSLEPPAALVEAPRLRIAEGQALIGRVVDDAGHPYLTRLRVASADYASDTLAAVRIELLAVEEDPTRRRSPRTPIGGVATLEAVSCCHVVDGDRVDGTLVDLSPGGVAFSTARVLLRGDRLRLRGRFFAETIVAEVRVASVRPSPAPGRTIAGCFFIEPDAALAAAISRVLDPTSARAGDDSWLTALRVAASEAEPSGWRRLLRRLP